MDTHYCSMKQGITPSKEFKKKRLAEFGANIGLKCGHGCLYCSRPALVRTHKCFRWVGHTAFEQGFAVVGGLR